MEIFSLKCQEFLNCFEVEHPIFNFYEKFISQSYAKPLKEAIKFHFLTERQTNRIDKPEWFFDFIQNILEINLNAFVELGVQGEFFSLKFDFLYKLFNI